MHRDPAWAFAYWDLREALVARLQKSDEFEGLMLRVYSLAKADLPVEQAPESSDIPVTLMDSSWYIHLPEQEVYYRIALVVSEGGSEQTLALSNAVAVPRGAVADRSAHNEHPGDEILAQTGIQDLDVPAEGKRIPQRILDLIDDELVFK